MKRKATSLSSAFRVPASRLKTVDCSLESRVVCKGVEGVYISRTEKQRLQQHKQLKCRILVGFDFKQITGKYNKYV